MKQFFSRKYGITYKYLFTVVPFLIISYLVLLLCVILFYWHSLEASSRKQKDMLLSAACVSLNNTLKQFSQDSSSFLYKNDTQKLLQKVRENNTDSITELSDFVVENISYYPTLSSFFLDQFYLIAADGTVLTSQGKVSNPVAISSAKMLLTYVKENVHKQHGLIYACTYGEQADSLLLSREIYLWTGKSETTGKILLATLIGKISADRFKQILPSGDECYSFAVTNENQEMLLNLTPLQDQELQLLLQTNSSHVFRHQRYRFEETSFSTEGLKLLLISNESEFFSSMYIFLFFQVIIVLISIGVILWAIYYVSSHISREFQFFIEKLESTSTIDQKAFIHMDTSDEFTTLSKVYNQMLTRIHTLSDTVHQQKLLTKDAQIKNLQAQINPHFLYNTLNCISGLIDMERKDDCQKAITALADIERMSLKGAPFCSLEKDLYYIRQYTFIQQLRFENKLLFLIDISQKLKEYILPKLVLQPLVENAILHGTSKMKEKGMIGIFAKEEDNILYISIKDNGPGFLPEFIADFPEYEKDTEQASHGMRNIDKRLKLYYGNAYGLLLSNNPGGGACVTIKIPCCTKEDMVNEHSKIKQEGNY